MDVRAFILGILAAIAFIGAIVLAALQRDAVTIAALIGAGSTFAGYIVGLYSSAYAEPQAVEPLIADEPASIVRARRDANLDAAINAAAGDAS